MFILTDFGSGGIFFPTGICSVGISFLRDFVLLHFVLAGASCRGKWQIVIESRF